MADALTATELVLAREQHLSQLDGLAAAAAHELGTPLVHHHGGGEGVAARARAGLAARRGREAVARAGAALPRDPRQAFGAAGRRHAVPAREALRADRRGGRAASQFRHRDRRGAAAGSRRTSRWSQRSPAILYGLGNLVENAVDFAAARVEIAVRWSEQDVAVTISDDGPGFPPEILARIGEPYVTSRRRTRRRQARKAASASGSSSPRRCWSAPARRSPSSTGRPPTRGPWCGCAGPRGGFRGRPSDGPRRAHLSLRNGAGLAMRMIVRRPHDDHDRTAAPAPIPGERTLLIVEDDKSFLTRLARAMEARGFFGRDRRDGGGRAAAGREGAAVLRGGRHAARRRQRARRDLGAEEAPPRGARRGARPAMATSRPR